MTTFMQEEIDLDGVPRSHLFHLVCHLNVSFQPSAKVGPCSKFSVTMFRKTDVPITTTMTR